MDNFRASLLLIAIALGSPTGSQSPGLAADVIFRCAIRNGVPTTVAQTAQGESPVIFWNSPDIAIAPNTTPQAECEAGSQRFQIYHDNGALNYISTGRTQGQLVACVTEQVGGGCRGTLFALQTTSSPRTALQRILRIRLPSEGPISHTGRRAYVDLRRYLGGAYNATTGN